MSDKEPKHKLLREIIFIIWGAIFGGVFGAVIGRGNLFFIFIGGIFGAWKFSSIRF